jgi:hypothetical protein
VKTTKVRNDKNGSDDLYNLAVTNVHLRNALQEMLNVGLYVRTISQNYTAQEHEQAVSLYHALQQTPENLPQPTTLPLYDLNLYSRQKNYVMQEWDAFVNEVPQFAQASDATIQRVISAVVSDITIENPIYVEPIYALESCKGDAMLRFAKRYDRCKGETMCQTAALVIFMFDLYICGGGNN